jgi:hypothetical protein
MMSRFALFFVALSACAADLTGIWAGQQPGRNGEVQDVAFRFKLDGQTLTGTLFGDEFDLPVGDASLAGDQIKFTITTTNYYSGSKSVFTYTGTVKGAEMELVRERIQTPEEKAKNRPVFKQTIKLKKLS